MNANTFRMSTTELVRLGTPEAKAELERRVAKRAANPAKANGTILGARILARTKAAVSACGAKNPQAAFTKAQAKLDPLPKAKVKRTRKAGPSLTVEARMARIEEMLAKLVK